MKDTIYIIYGFNRSDKELKKFCKDHDIEIGVTQGGIPLIFIDFEGTDREELRAVIAKCIPSITVVVKQLSDFGTGAKSKEIQGMIAYTGATVLVPEKILQKRGPKLKGELTPDQHALAQVLYDNKALSRQHVADVIEREYGVRFSRTQLATRFGK